MRKTTICFLLVLCSVLAFGQDEPQWKVVKHITLMQQNQPVSQALFTPTETAVYRVTFYFAAGGGNSSASWVGNLRGTDATGAFLGGGDIISCAHPNLFSISVMAVLKPDVPLTYEVDQFIASTSTCQYNLAITLEQLVQ